MSKKKVRAFSRAFKVAANSRVRAGDYVSALARELALRRKLLYAARESRILRSGRIAHSGPRVQSRPVRLINAQ